MRFFLLLAGAVSLCAQTCTYSVNPKSISVPAAAPAGTTGLSGTILVATQQSCVWTATPSAVWVHITNAQNYAGSQTVDYTIDPNTSQAVRLTTISIGDGTTVQPVNVAQAAQSCSYQVAPATGSLPAAGGSGSFQVATGCYWNVSAGASWVAITAPIGNTLANGTVSYTATANSCVGSRSAVLTVNTGASSAPPTFALTQAGSPDNISFSPGSNSYSAAAATGLVTVTTGQGCPWSVTNDASNWLVITNGSGSGFGPGAIAYSIKQNLGPQRVGHLMVGAQVYTVTQAAAATTPAPVLSAIVNSASGRTGPIAPGEIVSLFGANIGPTPGVPFGQTVSTTLGGVQVMFGSLAAPLTYVAAGQINAVVPYGVAGDATVPVEVQYSGQTSNALTATVQPAAPGIFSADMTGAGGGAILNQDYTLNAGSNPAAIGSAVMIYGTGGGMTNPPSSDGSPAPLAEPFARLALQPVTATIGGVPAQVSYSGGAPGLISGLTQFNVTIPAGVTPGPAVPVVVQVGGYQSQPGLTIALH